MDFEARFIDIRRRDDSYDWVTAIWCEHSGRVRRFTAENVKELQRAGHDFHVRVRGDARCPIHVVGAGTLAHLHVGASVAGPSVLTDLPDRSGEGSASRGEIHVWLTPAEARTSRPLPRLVRDGPKPGEQWTGVANRSANPAAFATHVTLAF